MMWLLCSLVGCVGRVGQDVLTVLSMQFHGQEDVFKRSESINPLVIETFLLSNFEI